MKALVRSIPPCPRHHTLLFGEEERLTSSVCVERGQGREAGCCVVCVCVGLLGTGSVRTEGVLATFEA